MCLSLFCLSSFLPHHRLGAALGAADCGNIMAGQKLNLAIQDLCLKSNKGSLRNLMGGNVTMAQNRRHGDEFEFVQILFMDIRSVCGDSSKGGNYESIKLLMIRNAEVAVVIQWW